MHFLKKILDFYIFSNIHVALAGFCLTKITLLKFGLSDSLTPVFVALSIIISYNFIRYFEIKTGSLNWFKDWFTGNKIKLIILSMLSLLLLGYITFFSDFNLRSIRILIPFAFITLFYVVPLFKVGKVEVSFRNFPSIKIFSIAIAWAGITVFFPLYEVDYEFTSNVYIEFVQRTLLLVAITIPFDIRDVNADPKSLKTLPQVFGVNTSKIIGYVLLLLVVFLGYFNKSNVGLDVWLVAFISGLFLVFSSSEKPRYYTSLWVEAVPILWFVLIVLF